jgi:benzylsuccinate CoA-transferase BbsF subunit
MLLFGPYIDFVAVGFGLVAVLAALDDRRHTGRGQRIDLSQYETGLQFIAPALLDFEVIGRIMSRNVLTTIGAASRTELSPSRARTT